MSRPARLTRRQIRQHAQRRRLVWWGLSSLCILLLAVWWWRASAPAPAATSAARIENVVQPGMIAPAIQLATTQGNQWSLAQQHGHVVVLAFLQTQPDTANTTSRHQELVLQSMQQQFGASGVQVAIIDGSQLVNGQTPATATLLNTTYDWHLIGMPLLNDPHGVAAQRFGVTALPTVFLIAPDGQVRQHWAGVSSATLAFALQPVLQQ